jgi:trans-4-hydroxy-L-proline dehydratase
MNARINKLREESLNAINCLSGERAKLITEFYKQPEIQSLPVPVHRGLALKYIMQHKEICINSGELIVGERGPSPKAVPTYPEICVHSLKDLEMLDTRPKVSYKVDQATKDLYHEEIIPFWSEKSIRDKMFVALPDEWKQAYQSGIFTEFMEQRAPGHTVAGEKVFRCGMLDIKEEIKAAIASLDFVNDTESQTKKEELDGISYACDALIMLAGRYANELENLAETEMDEHRKKELIHISTICRKVPAHAPQNFHEALQHYWFIHVGIITELNPWDSFNPGRLDQHLLPFYKNGLADGSLTREKAVELLQSFWIKFNNHPAPPKVGVTAQESNTYTDFCLINIGGLKEDGTDACNELSFIILDVIEEMRLLQPSSMVQLSRKNPDTLLHRALKIIKTGFGQPSLFNTDAIIGELTRQGKTKEDARNGGASGCVEAGAFGKEAYFLTGYFNLPKILEITLHNGTDPLTGKKLVQNCIDISTIQTFEEFMRAFKQVLRHFIDVKINGNNIIEKIYSENMPAPLMSAVIDDCIFNGKDYNAGGARYNSSYMQAVGLGTITDCLSSISYNVFEKRKCSLKELVKILDADFEGFDNLRMDFLFETPKYGNDDEKADRHATAVFNALFEMIDGRPTPRGGQYRVEMLPTTSHVYFGQKTGATPDGRKAYDVLSEGISPVQGADRKGPTAVVKSAACFDHLKTGGALLNQKLSPAFFKNPEAISKVGYLVRSYFRMNGHHIQFNVVNAETLKDAQKHPEKHRGLIVRVAGYSDYFCDLIPELQEEIIRRTEHQN